jgi:hypothetical protein
VRVGITPYLAEHDPQPGTRLADKIREAIRASDAVIVLLTTHSVDSPYVQQEIGVALEQDKLVVPVVHPAVAERSRAMLDGIEYISFDFEAPAAGAAALMSSLQSIGARAERGQQELQETAQRRQELLSALIVAGVIVALVALASAEAT